MPTDSEMVPCLLGMTEKLLFLSVVCTRVLEMQNMNLLFFGVRIYILYIPVHVYTHMIYIYNATLKIVFSIFLFFIFQS